MAAWTEAQLSTLIAVDLAIKNSIYQEASITKILQYITEAGSGTYLAFFSLILLAWAGKNGQVKPALTMAGGLLGVYLTVHVLKELLQRARPLGHVFTWAPGYSFPSGHSACSMFVYGFLIYWIFRQDWSKPYKYFTAAAIGMLIALVGFSRIYLNAHYASDVLVGFIFGFMGIVISIRILKRWEKH